MKNRLITNFFRKLKKNYKRFLSLLCMSLLGVGFYAGIKACAPDLLNTLDVFYDNNNVYDLKISSTLGLTNEDLKEIKELSYIQDAVLVNETDITNNTSSTINLVPVIEENEFINKDTVAPSSKGYFDIDINPTNVGVSFNYSITLQLLNENMPDLMITKYAILDNTYIEGDEIQTTVVTDNKIIGSLDFDNSTEDYAYEAFTIRVYFEWFEGEGEQMDNIDDTNIGHEAAINNTNLQIQATINFEQKLDASV